VCVCVCEREREREREIEIEREREREREAETEAGYPVADREGAIHSPRSIHACMYVTHTYRTCASRPARPLNPRMPHAQPANMQ
jgi:hypothetical protein